MEHPSALLRLKALANLKDKEYGQAVQNFLVLLTDASYPIKRIESDLVYAIDIYATSLSSLGHFVKAKWLWAKTVEIAKDRSVLLLYSYARFLCTIRDLRPALLILDKCINIDPFYAPAIESAENIKGLIVDRWHFRMVNDKQRNLTYKRCIERAVALKGPECTVLDIGGGTGLLSIYAVLAGCRHVYCCELNDDLASIAKQSIAEYGPIFSEKITVISKHSKDLKIGLDFDILEKADIIVTELVDSGLLGEHIIETLRDACERLLANTGTVIPSSATVYGYPIECDLIAARQRVFDCFETSDKDNDNYSNTNNNHSNYSNNNVNINFNNNSNSSNSSNIKDHNTSNKIPSVNFEVDEHYTCESLTSSFPYTPLSAACCMIHVKFKQPNATASVSTHLVADADVNNNENNDMDISTNYNNSNMNNNTLAPIPPSLSFSSSPFIPSSYSSASSSPSSSISEVELHITTAGRLDGFAYWFDLHLEEDITDTNTVSTAPEREQCGWDQAIIFGNKIIINDSNISSNSTSNTSYDVNIDPSHSSCSDSSSATNDIQTPVWFREGQRVSFKFSHDDDLIYIDINNRDHDNNVDHNLSDCEHKALQESISPNTSLHSNTRIHTNTNTNTLNTGKIPYTSNRQGHRVRHRHGGRQKQGGGVVSVGEMDLAMINDMYKNHCFLYGLSQAIEKMKKEKDSISKLMSVLDLSSNWSSTTLNALILKTRNKSTPIDMNSSVSNNPALCNIEKSREGEIHSEEHSMITSFSSIGSTRIGCPSKESAEVFRNIAENIQSINAHNGHVTQSDSPCVDINYCTIIKSYTTLTTTTTSQLLGDSSMVDSNAQEGEGEEDEEEDEDSGDGDEDEDEDEDEGNNSDSNSDSSNDVVVKIGVTGRNSGVHKANVHNHTKKKTKYEEQCTVLDEFQRKSDLFSIVVCDLIEGSGLIRLACLQELKFAMQFLTLTNAITVPYSVSVVCAIVECDSIKSHHIADSENMEEGNIAQHINKLGALQLRELDLAHMHGLRYLSQPVEALSFTLTSIGMNSSSTGDSNSGSTTVCSPVEIELEAEVAGVAHCVCYWYRLTMDYPDGSGVSRPRVLDTGPLHDYKGNTKRATNCRNIDNSGFEKINLYDINSGEGGDKSFPLSPSQPLLPTPPRHWRQAATLLSDPLSLVVGDVITVQISIDLSFGVLCSVI